MNDKLKYFCYSQNSINTYKSCPLKFKYKYIDNINWKHDDIESREYYEGLKSGREFHLLCERYFSNIPLGINDSDKSNFSIWISKIKKLIPINKEDIYLPEYEIRYNLFGNEVQAKYDLVILGKDKIEIYDWKTENRKINYKNIENRMQTIVYMFLAKEVIPKLFDINIDTSNIVMKYYQPLFEDGPITISYSDQKHNTNRNKLNEYINMIKHTKYDDEQKDYRYDLIHNKEHCKFCEFNKLCNGDDINYNILEEEIYEC
ncbi:PD-(D/E)XK nuclease family protein [Faecalimicrobium sp. JNUCC 81]